MRAPSVIVAGGGPVGVVAALAAAQAGFRVTLLEAATTLDTSPRAATTHPSTLEMIDRLGLLEQFVAEGLVARHFQFWDRTTQALVATFDHILLEGETRFPFVVQTEQHKLVRMGLDRLRPLGAEVRLGARMTGLAQDDAGVSVTVEADGATETLRADWLIGADGGRSTVRKALGIDFEGFTWPERFVVLTVTDDFEQLLGCCFRNYLSDPDEWTNLFKVSGDDGAGRWRAVFPTRPDEGDDDAMSDTAVQARLNRVFRLDRPYTVAHRNLYRVHQRVAASFRVGRVLLAGDAAHVNNPIGGLGLNFGIHDAVDAIDTLSAVALRGDDPGLLDLYARRRRMLNIEFVQEQTLANKKRLERKAPEERRAEAETLRSIARDPERARQFLLRSSLISSVRRATEIV